MPPRTLGETLRELREHRGMTAGQLAERAQVALSYVTLIESGHETRPTRQVLHRLARALRVPVERLNPEIPPTA